MVVLDVVDVVRKEALGTGFQQQATRVAAPPPKASRVPLVTMVCALVCPRASDRSISVLTQQRFQIGDGGEILQRIAKGLQSFQG